jgi:hypothetical protein
LDLIVRNGTVVTAEGKAEMNVGILEGRIESLVEPGRLERVMDLGGNPIEMRIPRSAYCLCNPRFSHS